MSGQLTHSARRHAALVACDRAVNATEAADLLSLLGLDQSLRTVARKVAHVAGYACQSCRSLISTRNARAAAVADPSIIPHGTANGYDRYGCRCDECREARRLYAAARREVVR